MPDQRRLRIAHLTSVHPRVDTRIFLKECRSLAAAGHEIFLIVADGLGDEEREGVQIRDAGKSQGRIGRMLSATRRVVRRGRAIGAEIYHLHDPELLLFAFSLRQRGARVIFDAHEDLPLQILSKPYLSPALRRPIAATAGAVQFFVCKRLDAVVGATPSIRDSFTARGIPAVDINNYPLLHELEAEVGYDKEHNEVCYVGGISAIRGIKQVVVAMALSTHDARLNLGGHFSDAKLQSDVESMAGWHRVSPLGFLSRPQVRDVLSRSIAGLVTFLPEANHLASQPNKMFEYMSAGLPVIASNFPMWRDIIEGHECGICVDPLDPKSIADAVDYLITNPETAKRMGRNGRRAVIERYNWGAEDSKLNALYSSLAPTSHSPPSPELIHSS